MKPDKIWEIKQAAEQVMSQAEAMYENTDGGEIDSPHGDDELLIMLIRNLNDKI